MTVKKLKLVLWPITTGAISKITQSEYLAITCNLLKAREKLRVQGAICFGFTSNWLKNLRGTFKPITKRSNHNCVITFDSHLRTAPSLVLHRTNWILKRELLKGFIHWRITPSKPPISNNSKLYSLPFSTNGGSLKLSTFSLSFYSEKFCTPMALLSV